MGFGEAWDSISDGLGSAADWFGDAVNTGWKWVAGSPDGGDTKPEDYRLDASKAAAAHEMAARAANRYATMERGTAAAELGVGGRSAVDPRARAMMGQHSLEQAGHVAGGKPAALAQALNQGGMASLQQAKQAGQSRGNEEAAMRNEARDYGIKGDQVALAAALAANERAAAQRAGNRERATDQYARDRASAAGIFNVAQSGIGAVGDVAGKYYADSTRADSEPEQRAKGYNDRLGY